MSLISTFSYPRLRDPSENEASRLQIESDISLFFENIQRGHSELMRIFDEWKEVMRNRIFELKNITNEQELEKSLFAMTCDLMRKNQEIIDKTKQSFLDSSKTTKLAFDSLALHVENEKKTLENHDLNEKIQFLEKKLGSRDLESYRLARSPLNEVNSTVQLISESNGEIDPFKLQTRKLMNELEESNVQISNLKIKIVELEFQAQSHSKHINELQASIISLKAENHEKCGLLIDLENKLEMILNENEKLTGILNEKLNIIASQNSEISQLSFTCEARNNEISYWKAKFEEKTSRSLNIVDSELRSLEEKSLNIIHLNEKLSNEIVNLVKELKSRDLQISKWETFYTKEADGKTQLLDKIKDLINLNNHLNDLLMIVGEELNSLKEKKEKFEQREEVISSLIEENNDLRAYVHKNYLENEDKNLMKLMNQQYEQEIMLLKEEKEELLRYRQFYMACEKEAMNKKE